MLDKLKQTGAVWEVIRKCEALDKSLDENQRVLLNDIKTSLRGIGGNVLPAELAPVVDYVLADNGEPTVVKAIGAAFQPSVRDSVAALLPSLFGNEGGVVVDYVTIKCRDCGHLAQYDLSK